MLCLPGLTPVAKLDQAVGDSEGWVEPSRAKVPSSARRLEVRELALVHPLPGERRVHAVEAHDEDALLRAAEGLAALRALPAVDEREGEGEGGQEGGGDGQGTAGSGREHRGHLLRQRNVDRVTRPVYPRPRPARTARYNGPSMSRPSSVLCPSCGTLVGVKDPQCLSCGRRNPGMWGFAHVLRNVGDDMGFATLVMWACGALYLASLAADVEGIRTSGLLSFFSPSSREPVPVRGERGGARSSATGAGGRC